MTQRSGEGWKGPGSRVGNAPPTPRCTAIGLRLLVATERQVTAEIADQLGAGVRSPEATADDPLLAGLFADCMDCRSKATVDLDRVGRIANVTPIPGYPSFATACRTIAGCALMSCFQQAEIPANPPLGAD